MDWQLILVAAASLCAGCVVGFAIGKAWGISVGWHNGYHAAREFHRLKEDYERQHGNNTRG